MISLRISKRRFKNKIKFSLQSFIFEYNDEVTRDNAKVVIIKVYNKWMYKNRSRSDIEYQVVFIN